MMTEDEARQKWCPFARVGDGNNRSVSPGVLDPGSAIACIASDCMAWRWRAPKTEKRILPTGKQPEPDAMTKGWRTPTTTIFSGDVVWVRTLPPTLGYCGLAGQVAP